VSEANGIVGAEHDDDDVPLGGGQRLKRTTSPPRVVLPFRHGSPRDAEVYRSIAVSGHTSIFSVLFLVAPGRIVEHVSM
jgi:hypothetical protein